MVILKLKLCFFFQGLEKQDAAKRLWAVTKLINQAVGDALSGLLLVEAILQTHGMVSR